MILPLNYISLSLFVFTLVCYSCKVHEETVYLNTIKFEHFQHIHLSLKALYIFAFAYLSSLISDHYPNFYLYCGSTRLFSNTLSHGDFYFEISKHPISSAWNTLNLSTPPKKKFSKLAP